MKKLILLSLFAMILPQLIAQNVDVLYMKNGSLIRGTIEELIPGKTVRMLDKCGNSIVYDLNEVEKITSEEMPGNTNGDEYEPYRTGLVNITSIGLLVGSISNEQPAPFSIQSTIGWRLPSGLQLGGGMGLEFISSTHMPFFADLRFDFFDKPVTPCLIAKGGYAIPLQWTVEKYSTTYSYSGGPMAAFGIGLKIRSRNEVAWDISMLYRFQQINYNYVYSSQSITYDYSENYSRVELRLGLYLD